MDPIRSPIERGDVTPHTVNPLVHFFTYARRCGEYLDSIKAQLAARGPVLASEWGSADRLAVARELEAILGEHCWGGEKLQFHPEDPWFVVGEWEMGDLSEVEALMETERRFDISLPFEEVRPMIERGGTFGDFVDLVMRKQPTIERDRRSVDRTERSHA